MNPANKNPEGGVMLYEGCISLNSQYLAIRGAEIFRGCARGFRRNSPVASFVYRDKRRDGRANPRIIVAIDTPMKKPPVTSAQWP
jgi:hypothetical protein